METGEEILEGLATTPGMDVVFIDETGTSGKPLPNLAADFQLICGVTFASSTYAEVRASLRDHLASLGPRVPEFHATEIVNPRATSPWKSISFDSRLEAFQLLSALLTGHASEMSYCYVSGEQYPELLAAARETTEVSYSQKRGLRHVFFESLLARLRSRSTASPIAIVSDSERPLSDAIKIRSVIDLPGLYQGGVIEASSDAETGLQIADFAAYLLNRSFHATQRARESRETPFDELVLATYESIRPRLRDLLAA